MHVKSFMNYVCTKIMYVYHRIFKFYIVGSFSKLVLYFSISSNMYMHVNDEIKITINQSKIIIIICV